MSFLGQGNGVQNVIAIPAQPGKIVHPGFAGRRGGVIMMRAAAGDRVPTHRRRDDQGDQISHQRNIIEGNHPGALDSKPVFGF